MGCFLLVSLLSDEPLRDNAISPNKKIFNVEPQAIIFEMLLDVYRDIDLGNNIADSQTIEIADRFIEFSDVLEVLKIRDEKEREMIMARGQFREGYIYQWRNDILRIDTDAYVKRILNNDSGGVILPLLGGPRINVDTSSYYTAGRIRAARAIAKLRNNIQSEVRAIRKTFFSSDNREWLKDGRTVPESELAERIKSAPHLQATIVLQTMLRESVSIKIESKYERTSSSPLPVDFGDL